MIFGLDGVEKGFPVSWPQDDSDFAATLMRLLLPAVAASGGLMAPFSFHEWGDVKPQTMEKFSVSHEFQALVGGGDVPRRYERVAAILAMEGQYSAHLSIMRRDQYHWKQMQLRGPLIDWPLLCTWVAFSRFKQFFTIEEIPVPNEDAKFIRWLAMEIATREPRGSRRE